MTGMDVVSVNVRIEGVHFEAKEAQKSAAEEDIVFFDGEQEDE